MKPKVKTWINQINSGMIRTNTARVLHYIMNNDGCTILHIRADLMASHQTITAILSVLMDEGIVTTCGELSYDTNHYSKLRFVNDEQQQKLCRKARSNERFNKLVNSMSKFSDRIEELQQHLDILKMHTIHYSNN